MLQSLAGLPEVPLLIIIPYLRLVDRSSLASTCKRLYAFVCMLSIALAMQRISRTVVMQTEKFEARVTFTYWAR